MWKLGGANFRWLGCLAGRRIIISMNIINNINIIILICFRGDDSSGGVVVVCRTGDILISNFVSVGMSRAVARP